MKMETMSAPSAVSTSSRRGRSLPWPLIFIVLALGVVWFLFGKNYWMNRQVTSEYQSVFLENGQVYFGKLEYKGSWIKLTDVYYLQVTDPLQVGGEVGTNSKEQNIQLIKLGSELHGPKDEMFISKSKVLFWENMKDEAKVLQSIKDYQLKSKQP
ncbi:hypothetical protein HZA26_02710 [Candidatus Nomurabacteria bacterium]|nr:hypothetical protein [Candidatus Nomurabacteria bacterium]